MDAGGTGRKQEEWEDRRNREMGLVCKIRLFKKGGGGGGEKGKKEWLKR